MYYKLRCDPKGYLKAKKIILLGEIEGFDGCVKAVEVLTGQRLEYCTVKVDVCLPDNPVYPDGYGNLEQIND